MASVIRIGRGICLTDTRPGPSKTTASMEADSGSGWVDMLSCRILCGSIGHSLFSVLVAEAGCPISMPK